MNSQVVPPGHDDATVSNPAISELNSGPFDSGSLAIFVIGFVTLAAELWLGRSLSLLVGADATGIALTVGAFLIGNAAGSWWASRGVSGPFVWSLAALISFVLAGIWIEVLLPNWIVGWSNLQIRSVSVLPVALPAFTLGGLPVVWFGTGFLNKRETRRRVGSWIGLLDIGSALGALSMPLILLPYLGNTGSAFVLFLCLLISVSLARSTTKTAERSPLKRVPQSGPSIGRILICAVVGIISLSLQMTHVRLLGEMLGTSLAVLGVATASGLLGAAWAAWRSIRVIETGDGRKAIVVAIGVWLMAQSLSALLIALAPVSLVRLLMHLGADPGWMATWLKYLAVSLVVLPPSLASGFILPILISGWCSDSRSLRRQSGPLNGSWLIGGALGAWSCGLWILPIFGSGRVLLTLGLLTALMFVWGGLAQLYSRRVSLRFLLCLIFSGTCSLVAINRWEPALLGAGVYHWHRGDLASGDALSGWRHRQVTYVGEGALAKVSIEVTPDHNASYLRVGGRIEGSVPINPALPSLADLPTEIMLGLLPTVEGSGKGSLLVIGLGGGTTATAAVQAWQGNVTILEVEAEVAKALASDAGAAAFPDEHECLFPENDSGPEIIFEDARSFLARSELLWDAVICQPSEPWLPWSAPLFTGEFYQLVRDRLSKDGVAVHWLQLYRIGPMEFAAILREFVTVFPSARAYHPPGTGEVILVGGKDATLEERENSFWKSRVQGVWSRMNGVRFPGRLIDDRGLKRWLISEKGRSTRDLRSRLEYQLPLMGDRGEDRSSEILRGLEDAARSVQ